MRTILLFTLLLITSYSSVSGQNSDVNNFVLLQVIVTNFNNIPQKGEQILFEGQKSKLVYKGVSNTEGKFEAIASAIDSVNTIIEKLNSSSVQLMENKNLIISLTENLSAISEQNAAGTEEASASMEEQSATIQEIANSGESLASIAEELQSLVAKFRV